jgi:chemotaxis protein CheZ
MNPMKTDDANDSEDLQALFDTIAADAKPVPPPAPTSDSTADNEDLQALFDTIAATPPQPVAPPPPAAAATGDNDDLQALFDSVAEQAPHAPAVAPASEHHDASSDDMVFNRLGQLARQLHDSLRELGYDQLLQDASQQIPDARQRLTYIAQMTEQAASRVLNATDIAKPMIDDMAPRAVDLSARWDKMFANQLSVDEFKQLASDSRAFFNQAPAKLQVCNEQLTDIMMAQDFQDLTGQVIKKVVDLANGLEEKMMKVLIEVMPPEKRSGAAVSAAEGLMNGPVIDATGRNDVVNNQSQVDDLLESLGF